MIHAIRFASREYPKNLKSIHKPPKTLFVNGTLKEDDEYAVALVGSRRATHYGTGISEKLAYDLATRGVTVISGMARGIDTAAHRGALRAKGRTIAVLGSGHNHIYPPQNEGLYHEIAKSGAVVTEFEDDTAPLPYNFPQRNRIISGLSLAVVVVEAARNSGALITADFALEQGRDVLAVPGQISSSTSLGANELIKAGAKLVQTADDILEELENFKAAPVKNEVAAADSEAREKKTRAYIYNSLTEAERKVFKLLNTETLHIDEIAAGAGLDAAQVSKVLLDLEIKRLIRSLPGGHFVRVHIPAESGGA